MVDLLSAEHHSWYWAMCVQRVCKLVAGQHGRPAMRHPYTACNWRGTECCWLSMADGTSHYWCMLHAYAMLRALPSKAGCVRGMQRAGYALSMGVLGFAPLIASQGHAPFSWH